MGGEGKGPGEFASTNSFTPPPVLKIRNDKIYVWDKNLQRINVYSIEDFQLIHTINLDPQNWHGVPILSETGSYVNDYHPLNDRALLVEFRETFSSDIWRNVSGANPHPEEEKYVRIYKIDYGGNIASELILKVKDVNFDIGKAGTIFKGIPPHLPSTRNSQIAVSNSGSIFTAWTDSFHIEKFTKEGEFQDEIYFSYENSSLDKNDIIQQSFPGMTNFQEQVENAKFSDTWPAINKMILDNNGRLWVSTVIDDENHFQWWVLDHTGNVIANFTWAGRRLLRHSENNHIRKVVNDYLYTYETNADDDLGFIGIYKIHLNHK